MPHKIAEIQEAYNLLVSGIDDKAHVESEEGNRAYGGMVRSAKGILVEGIAKHLVEIAWDELGGSSSTHTLLSYFDVDLNIITLAAADAAFGAAAASSR